MNYDVFSRTAPAMPKPSKGTEIVKLLLSQVSKEMQEPLLPMTLPALAAHIVIVIVNVIVDLPHVSRSR